MREEAEGAKQCEVKKVEIDIAKHETDAKGGKVSESDKKSHALRQEVG